MLRPSHLTSLLLVLIVVFRLPLAGQSSPWTQFMLASPSPNLNGMPPVYDPGSNRLILFGGCASGPWCTAVSDTWVITNANGIGGAPQWQKLSVSGTLPPGRAVHSAVYDQTTNRMIIFGGGTGGCGDFCTLFNDVWVLSNANGLGGAPTWTELLPLTPNGAPAPRAAHQAVYDPNTNRMTIFGGSNDGIMTIPNDTWVLTNANGLGGTPEWIPLSPGGTPPAPTSGFIASYDPSTNAMTIFGGCCPFQGTLSILSGANGTGASTWQSITQSSPEPGTMSNFNSGYDPQTNSLLFFGGSPSFDVFVNGVWVLTNANGVGTPTWANPIPNGAPGSPPPGAPFGAYDAVTKRLMILPDAADLWVLDATAIGIGPAAPVIPNTPAPTNAAGTSITGDPQYSNSGSIAEPVNTGNGNYFYSHADLSIPGRGLPLVFQRSYNTLDNYAGPLGVNWNHNLNISLSQTAAGVASIRWGDGHGESFTLTGTSYVPRAGVYDALVANGDGTYTLSQKNRTKYGFSSAGKLTTVQDRNGNAIVLTYDGSGNLTQITDTVGRSLLLSYDPNNRITKITDPIGRTIAYSYDSDDNLISVTDPAGGVTQYAYDANHRVTSITQPNGTTLLQNSYDASGRVVSQTNGRDFTWQFAYNTPVAGTTTITDGRGNNTLHTYDSSLRIVQIADPLKESTRYAYDVNNDRISVTNPDGATTNLTYDASGNVMAVTDALNETSTFTYDGLNDLLSATNPKGNRTAFSYDSHGNLTAIQDAAGNNTALVYDSVGELISRTDATGNATTFAYDSFGNLVQVADALSEKTTLSYDGIGRLVSATNPNSHTSSATYDALSRLMSAKDALGDQTQFAYDAIGNLVTITDANGHATSYTYDAANNLLTVTDALGHVTRYGYDPNNNRTSFTNAKGASTAYAFDLANRLAAITDSLSFITSYSYDPTGNVTATKDADGNLNRFTYDALNRLTAISYADGQNVAYTYDANGNRSTMVDWRGTTNYSYDILDRILSVATPDGKTAQYGYDAVGRRTSLSYPDGKHVGYIYDPAGRLSQVEDWLARTTRYSYDVGGNLTGTAYPNGASIAFSHDAANRLTGVQNSAAGRWPILNFAYTLDAVGNRTALSADGIVTQFGYDALNELTSAQLGFLKSTWTYDAVGNRTQQTEPFLGTTSYTYDAGDRLLQAGFENFTYDANGNEISVVRPFSPKLLYKYDAANRLVAATGGLVNSAYAYDGDGNRVLQSTPRGTYLYANDVATVLPLVLNEQGPDGNIDYAYGLDLIEEDSAGFNYFYHYDGLGSVVALTNSVGKPQAAYAYDPWGNPLLTLTDSVGTKNKFRFTGEALDPSTGLYFLRSRYYAPEIGRFISEDPLSAMNRYWYAVNNPLLFSDPTGALSWEGVWTETMSCWL